MPVTPTSPAPYAPAGAVLDIIQRHRSRGLPSPVTLDVLQRAGVSESLIPRTLQTLKTLDLIDEDGRPTPIFEGLRLAPEGEFRQRLAEWLNGAYADVLTFVDPASADETSLRDAFRSYTPVGQQPRMVSLFTGLYTATGLSGDKATGGSRPPRRQRPKVSTVSTNGGGAASKTRPAASSRPDAPTSSVNQPEVKSAAVLEQLLQSFRRSTQAGRTS